MTIRTFIFCDICNQRGIRTPEMRQGSHRDSEHRGRRVTDSRAWYEGEVKDAIAAGWQIDLQGRHVCPRCHQAHKKTLKNYSPQTPLSRPVRTSVLP